MDLKSEIQEWIWILDPKMELDLKSEIQDRIGFWILEWILDFESPNGTFDYRPGFQKPRFDFKVFEIQNQSQTLISNLKMRLWIRRWIRGFEVTLNFEIPFRFWIFGYTNGFQSQIGLWILSLEFEFWIYKWISKSNWTLNLELEFWILDIQMDFKVKLDFEFEVRIWDQKVNQNFQFWIEFGKWNLEIESWIYKWISKSN